MNEVKSALAIFGVVLIIALFGLGFVFSSGANGLAVRGSDTLKPQFVSEPDTTTPAGQAYSYSVIVNSDSPPVQYSLMQAPNGMTIDPNSGVLTWTPDSGQIGQYNVQIIALDSLDRSSAQEFTLFVYQQPSAP